MAPRTSSVTTRQPFSNNLPEQERAGRAPRARGKRRGTFPRFRAKKIRSQAETIDHA